MELSVLVKENKELHILLKSFCCLVDRNVNDELLITSFNNISEFYLLTAAKKNIWKFHWDGMRLLWEIMLRDKNS